MGVATGSLTVINRGTPVLEPFLNLTDAEISKLILDSTPMNHEIKPAGRSYIEGMAAYARVRVKEPYLNMFLNCPYGELFNHETKTLNLSTKREHIVKPEEISRMGFYEAYICDSFRRELAHVEIT